jgi:hypothetical protein
MTIPVRHRSPRYNKLKKVALEIFERHGGWLSPPEWAVLAGFYPIRAAYSYLLRLHRFGLLLMDLPVLRGDDAERLRQKIVEASIGARLNSQAIRGARGAD